MRGFLARRAGGPFAVGVLLGVGLIVAGFAVIALGWRGTARSLVIPLQTPYLISAALGAVALIGVGAALLNAQWERLSDAEERRALDGMIDEAAALLDQRRSSSRVSE